MVPTVYDREEERESKKKKEREKKRDLGAAHL